MTSPAPAVSAQAAQSGLVTAMGYDVERAWNHLDVSSLRRSLPGFTALIAALVHRYSQASATLAAREYLAQRHAAGVQGAFTVKPAPPPALEQVGQTVDWATQPLWATQPDVKAAETRLEGSLDTLVLDVGRQTIVDNTLRDKQAKAWARVPEPGCCYFCALLATRGAVYKESTAGFKSHDHCRCHAEPVFTAYEPSAQIRQWQALYREVRQGVRGMKATQQTWRQAFDSQ